MFLGRLIRFTMDHVHKIITLLKEFFMALRCVTQRSDGISEPAFLLHALLAQQIYTLMVLSASFSVFCSKLYVNFSLPMDL